MTDSEEEFYVRGRRSFARRVMAECAIELDGEERSRAHLMVERSAAIESLRHLAKRFGLPTDWDDDLHMADVVDKWIERPLVEMYEPDEDDSDE